jgi:mannosyltransferase OCH1-like enzyme
MLSVVYSNINFIKILGLNIWEFFSKVFFSKLIPFSLLLIIGLGVNKLVSYQSWGSLMIKAIAFVVAYTCIMFVFMKKAERVEFVEPMKHLFHLKR